VERNHFGPRDFTCYVGISNLLPLCSRSVTRSCYKMFRFNSSPCRCRSEQTPVNRGNKGNNLFKRKLLQQTIPGSEKGRNLPPCNRPQPAQQVFRPFHTVRDSVPLALYSSFFHRQSQTLCLFLASNRVIQSLHPLLGCVRLTVFRNRNIWNIS